MDFVVYHGAFERETTEGPYDPARAATGIDTLVKALDDHGIPPNANVCAELGTTWREVMSEPDQAAHVLGKLLLHVGEDRVLWGTDAIWYGSPQPQIMAFRAFQITRRVPGALRLPGAHGRGEGEGLRAQRRPAVRPRPRRDPLRARRRRPRRRPGRGPSLAATGALPAPWQPRGPITRREMLGWLSAPSTRWTPW